MQKPVPESGSLLHDKSAIVTGAASGIGFAIASAFARQGAHVALIDLNETAAQAAVSKIGTAAEVFPCDVADSTQVRRTFAAISERGPIHILINCAGVAHVGTLASTSEDDFDRLLRINVRGMYLCCRAAIAPMQQNGGGVILNMASIAGMAGLPDRFAYSTTKGAVLAMTYSIARDYLKDKIRCNAISPARVHTPFVDGFVAKNYPGREAEMMEKLGASQPIGRMAEPDEVASLAVWLCSDEANFVTGANYPLDGGFIHLR